MEQITCANLLTADKRNDLSYCIKNKSDGRMLIVINSASSADVKQAEALCNYLKLPFSFGLNRLNNDNLLLIYEAFPIRIGDGAHGAQELRSVVYSLLELVNIELENFDSLKKLYLSICLMWGELYEKYRECNELNNRLKTNQINTKLDDIINKINHTIDREYYVDKRNSISEIQTKAFIQYKNIHSGEDVALVATGPSLKAFKKIDGITYCGVNKAFKYDSIKLDYLFMVDYNATKSYIEEAKNYPCKKFYGIVRDVWEKCIIPESISIEAGASRFFLEGIRNPIHYVVDICNEPLGDCGSVIFSAMQFLLWTNPRTIYLIGVDCTRNIYFDSDNNELAEPDPMYYKGWVAMKKFVNLYYPKTQIVSINPRGLKGLFEDCYQ